MKVYAKIFATLVSMVPDSVRARYPQGIRAGDLLEIELSEGSTLADLVDHLGLPRKKVRVVFVNGRARQLDYELAPGDVHVGPSDYVPWLTDRKFCYIQMEGTTFGEVPLKAEIKLEVWDSPNSAGVVIDAVRCCKLALDRGIGGAIGAASSYFMKSPPIQFTDEEARRKLETFIAGAEENE